MKFYKSKVIDVSKEVMEHYNAQVGKKKGRVSEKDTDKWLEKQLCKLAFNDGIHEVDIQEPDKSDDIKKDIDVIVNGKNIQVKCRKRKAIYLEEYKTRKWRQNPGWTRRSKADLYLFVYPKTFTSLECFLFTHKTILGILEDLDSEIPKRDVLTKWGLLEAIKHEEVVSENGDGEGCYWEVLF